MQLKKLLFRGTLIYFKKSSFKLVLGFLFFLSCLYSQTNQSEQTNQIQTKKRRENIKILNLIKILPSYNQLVGSGQRIGAKEIKQFSYDNISQILKDVPGIQVRSDDGYGLVNNIGIRGSVPNRSKKITLLEDGIIIQPAPYGSPAAYYSPTIFSKGGIEVLKGASKVKYGPHTIGGVINYLTAPIPSKSKFLAKTTYGSGINKLENDVKALVSYGNTIYNEKVNIGFLIQNYFRHSSGYKTITETADFDRGEQTGFIREEPLLKVTFDFLDPVKQSLEINMAYNKLEANESYLGLLEEDFNEDPFNRYTASRFDRLTYDHWRSFIRHNISKGNVRFSTAAYFNYFHRNWYRIIGEDLVSNIDLYRGNQTGTWNYQGNNRHYYSGGVEIKSSIQTAKTTEKENFLEWGIRYHIDQFYRYEFFEDHQVNAQGEVTNTIDFGPGSKKNQADTTHAVSIYALDRLTLGKWILEPGLRLEIAHYTRDSYRLGEQTRYTGLEDSRNKAIVGGFFSLGAAFKINKYNLLFANIHQGSSLPGPSSITTGAQTENSINFELGYRHFEDWTKFETALFLNGIANLLEFASTAAGIEETRNSGSVVIFGIESLFTIDPGKKLKWAFLNPYTLSFNITRAAIGKGKQLSYIPLLQFSLGTGLAWKSFGMNLSGKFIGDAYGNDENEESSDTDATIGLIPARFLLDLNLFFNVNKNFKVFVNGYNLLNQTYIASRLPIGARPGRGLTLSGGVETKF